MLLLLLSLHLRHNHLHVWPLIPQIWVPLTSCLALLINRCFAYVFVCVCVHSVALVLSVEAQSLLRSVSPFFSVALLPFSTSFPPFLTRPLEGLFSFLFIHPAFPLHKWADLCMFESLFFLTWRIHYRYFSELGSRYFTAFSGNPFKSNCRTCPPSPYSCIALRVRGRTPLVDSSPTDGHLGFLPKFEMTDNAVMDSVGQIHVHLVGTAPSEHASRRGTAGSKAHVCVVLSDFAQFPIRIPQQCLRAPVSHKLTNRMYC